MVLQSSTLSGPVFGPSVAAMEPASVPLLLPPLLLPLLPLPMLKLSPLLSTNCQSSFYHSPGSAVLCRAENAF